MAPSAVSDAGIREVTEAEVQFYRDHGWVKLPGLLSRKVAAELLAAARELMAGAENQSTEDSRGAHTQVWTKLDEFGFHARNLRHEPFFSISMNEAMGRAAQRLADRAALTDEPIPIHYVEDTLLCKLPAGSAKDLHHRLSATLAKGLKPGA